MVEFYRPGVTGETDKHWAQAIMNFKWPCAERVAHAPHPITDTIGLSDQALAEAIIRSGDQLSCPGVSIHPACMIGQP